MMFRLFGGFVFAASWRRGDRRRKRVNSTVCASENESRPGTDLQEKCDFLKRCSVSSLFLDCSITEQLSMELYSRHERERERISKLTTRWDATPTIISYCGPIWGSESFLVRTVTQTYKKEPKKKNTHSGDGCIDYQESFTGVLQVCHEG